MTQTQSAPQPVPGPAELRATLASFATGVAVITTTTEDGAPHGMTVNSFNAVSLDPALVLWSLALSAGSLPIWRAARGFAVNILAQDQSDLCRLFSSRIEDRFSQVDWHRGLDGLPVLDGAVATLQCRYWARYPGGDHEIMVGHVLACARNDQVPLVYCQGKLGGLRVA
jgi:flavin reductase (DIM6/NTAB) family NADH-FMN oxidoreductase RutF